MQKQRAVSLGDSYIHNDFVCRLFISVAEFFLENVALFRFANHFYC